ncbi:FMN-binding negative transcriptional regulator [Thiothrix fructosivorans]|uniref:FMN-binding negative transcriptional regulator n=1 Tax=Thiothrix fructosivorans TaxID=111770 RepID=A0A8B0SFG3_9GAMM|nr:FMN-binding negative transcriptional regulator [Thiothrix fructosivorans]MBO0615117.1 FMN-binding negative transcriptional regulator [Thiothrix fructosivorans]QTX09911.1 FMN-binding negative transcriptional regulator [Thiothrix fructosivorans]
MYLPKHFEEHDQTEILRFIEAHAFGTLVTVDAGVPFASHIPFLLEQGETLMLSGHLAKANPQWQHLAANSQVLAMFQGAHAYVSPTWYEGAGVPTWNYTAVHVYGKVRVIHDADWLREKVERLSAQYEGSSETAWLPSYPAKMLEAIVGFEITIESLQAKYKLSQNRSAADQRNVMQALDASEGENERGVAALMAKYQK